MVSETYVFHCPYDFTELKRIGTKSVINHINEGPDIFLIYQCPTCGRRYSANAKREDLEDIQIGESVYINLRRYKDELRYRKHLKSKEIEAADYVTPGTECYVIENRTKVSTCHRCRSVRLIRKLYRLRTRNKKEVYVPVFECLQCGAKHVYYHAFSNYNEYWVSLNSDELPAIRQSLMQKALVKKGIEEKKENKQQGIKADSKTQRAYQSYLEVLEEARRTKVTQKSQLSNEYEEDLILDNTSDKARCKKEKVSENQIDARDFVVRRTVFKCRYKDHNLQNIVGLIDIINKKGEIRPMKITAGYCTECKIFFIMESVYQNLKIKGTPVCRVSNEKAYLSNNAFANGMDLAQESVLKQYGYSVAQEDGLTSMARRKILALIIDNHILTKNEVIGYLDFFINQRKNQSRFEKAIDKWESDREFVAEYQKGEYKQYGIGGIYRKY